MPSPSDHLKKYVEENSIITITPNNDQGIEQADQTDQTDQTDQPVDSVYNSVIPDVKVGYVL